MIPSRRRRWNIVLVGFCAVLIGVAALVGALAGDTERVGEYWLHASIDAEGRAEVTEVIDYDFGVLQRHGIFRDIPDVDPLAPITVTSATAPDQFTVASGFGEAKVKIGDPNETISNRHRYTIVYPIDTLVVGDRLDWNAVGLDWLVPINHAEIHVTADRAFLEPVCHRGQLGDVGGCEVRSIEPGHLLVEVSGLSSGEAVTVEATLGAALTGVSPVVAAPTGTAPDPGTGALLPALVAAAAALLGGAVISRRVRMLGREQVWEGGAADAAFGPTGGMVVGTTTLDYEQLAEMASIEFASPRGLSAAAGGIIHAEQVKSEHQIAWLIECAIRDEVVLEEDEDGDVKALVRGPADPHPAVAPRLDALFDGGSRIELGSYDSAFAKAWGELGGELEAWRKASGLWDPAGHRRRTKARIFGSIGALVGLALAVLGGVIANRTGLYGLVPTVIGAALAGAGIAALIRSWELPIRTPQGSGYWLQIESFRRFIEGSEAQHAEAAARMGLLRQYTAWAVALGELNHWKHAVEAAAAVPGSAAMASSRDFHFVALAPSLSSATAQTFTSPSSSSGGGGGAGGGGGGGGGGSW